MKQYSALFFLLWLLPAYKLFANHIYGGELQYSHISGLSYKVTLTLYGDCQTSNDSALAQLFSATPEVEIHDGQALFTKIVLQVEGVPGVEITPVCPQMANSTSCNGGNLPGIRKFIYSAAVTLPQASAEWNFIFAGALGGNTGAGRSSNLTNIASGTAQQVYLKALLNNMAAPNNSTEFTTIPTPFYCINVPQSYNQGAVDPDNDSLVFSLVPAVSNSGAVAYLPGYSGSHPLSAGTFSFDNLNGQMTFTPDIAQRSLVVNQVEEYRNGVLVGSTVREMTFIVLDNCQNTAPVNVIDPGSVIGGIVSSGNTVNVCLGTPQVAFVSEMNDIDGDTLSLSVSGLPTGASLQITGNNTQHPSLHFNWNTFNLPAGIYNFYIHIKDNHCPLNSSQTLSLTIRIVPDPTVIIANQPTTVCIGEKIFLQYSGADHYQWLPEDKIFYEPDSSIFIRVYEPGTYTLIGTTDYGCDDTATLTYTNVQQCCTFSYPTAFTPNNDRHNDNWRPLIYGNQEYYELSIYNRWGQILFHSFIPGEGWNGTYQGQPCAMDTYFYLLKSKCLTGHEEEYKGEFTLIK